MKRTVTTPAAIPPAALAELKDWLGISISKDDAQLTQLLRTSLEACEHFTGTMPLQQSCEEVLAASSDWQVLAARPVQAITGIDGLPAEGTRFALPVGDYEVDLSADGTGSLRVSNPGSAGRVIAKFDAGLASEWTALPEGLRHGVLRLAAFQYRAREGGEETAQWPPAAVAALWRPWRRLRLA
ncbi:MAG: hypothetical protein ACKOOL_11860 [Novosphingobium sp.]